MEISVKEVSVAKGSGQVAGPKVPVTSLTAIRKGLPVDKSLFRQAIEVNGQVEYEEPWSLGSKVLLHMYLIPCMIESWILLGLFFVFVRPFLRDMRKKKDPRTWPVSNLFYRPSSAARYLRAHATTWRAIEYLYTQKEREAAYTGFDRWLSSYLGSVENILATRNRLRNTKSALFWQLHHRFSTDMKDISVLSVAAGSARATIEALMPFLREDPNRLERVRLGFLDDDPSALEFATEFAAKSFPGLEKRLTLRQMKISASNPERFAEFEKFLEEFDPEIVEMVGFTDYMSRDKAVKVMNAINRHMRPGGFFITNNVKPNHERRFLELCVAWRMINRSEAEMLGILEEAGFTVFRTLNEPTNIQPVYAALKDVSS